MGEAVQQCPCQAFVAEDLDPAGELQVCGDEDTAAEVAFRADLEEETGALGGEGYEAHLVQLCGQPHNSTYVAKMVMWSNLLRMRAFRGGSPFLAT